MHTYITQDTKQSFSDGTHGNPRFYRISLQGNGSVWRAEGLHPKEMSWMNSPLFPERNWGMRHGNLGFGKSEKLVCWYDFHDYSPQQPVKTFGKIFVL